MHRQRMMPKLGLALVLVLVVSGIVGAQGVAKNLTVGVHQDVTTFDPRIGSDVTSVFVNQLLYSSLVRVGDDLSIQPDLAERWETPTPTRYVFHLREGVLFHDGVELTAEDVKYTYDTILDPSFGSPKRSLLEALTEVNVLDKYTVEFVLDDAFPPLMYYLDTGIVPAHWASEDPDRVKNRPLGSGPYKFVEWVANNRIVLDAFDEYFEGAPNFPRLTFRVMIEDTVRLIEFETGGIDVIYRVPYDEVLRMQSDPRYTVYEEAINGYGYMMMNHNEPPFDDVRVRQAVAYALDKDAITELVYWDVYDTADAPIIPQSWAYSEDLPVFEQNVAKARELLAEAGYPNGFRVTFKTYSQTDKVQFAQVLVSQLAQAGIDVNIEISEWSKYFAEVTAGDYVFGGPMFWYYQTDPDQALFRQFHSEMVPPRGTNRHYYANPLVDELLEKARREPDQEVRAEYYEEIQKHLIEDVSYIFLWYPRPYHAANPGIANPSFSPYTGYFDFVRVGYWQ